MQAGHTVAVADLRTAVDSVKAVVRAQAERRMVLAVH